MKTYKLLLSNKQEIEVDEQDFEKIKKEIGSGNLIQVKQAIFNPSFIVCILPVEKESKKVLEGYIDEKRGVFVATGSKQVPLVEDKFKVKGVKSIAEVFKN